MCSGGSRSDGICSRCMKSSRRTYSCELERRASPWDDPEVMWPWLHFLDAPGSASGDAPGAMSPAFGDWCCEMSTSSASQDRPPSLEAKSLGGMLAGARVDGPSNLSKKVTPATTQAPAPCRCTSRCCRPWCTSAARSAVSTSPAGPAAAAVTPSAPRPVAAVVMPSAVFTSTVRVSSGAASAPAAAIAPLAQGDRPGPLAMLEGVDDGAS
mmetsp:Transcript_11366/g.23867  ORF Transcript_11366/g.23867 Transcript_11366/m.23867 type:complete len:211 (+) Transcript_11366:278-910(+)